MVGAIEENEGVVVEKIEMGVAAEAVTREARAVNASREEGVVAETQEISPQVVEIKTSSKIKGTVIEQEEPLSRIGEVSTLLTLNKKRKISSVGGESSRRRRTRES